MRLEDVTSGAQILGIARDALVTVVAVTWIGGNAVRLTYPTDADRLDDRLMYCDYERGLQDSAASPVLAVSSSYAPPSSVFDVNMLLPRYRPSLMESNSSSI